MEKKLGDINDVLDALSPLSSSGHYEAMFVLKKVCLSRISFFIHTNSLTVQVTGLASALCYSDQKSSVLKECCTVLNIPFCKPVKVVATHWNFHIATLHHVYKNKAAISKLT